MTLPFLPMQATTATLGVARRIGGDVALSLMPTNPALQDELRTMAAKTWDAIGEVAAAPVFDVSEEYPNPFPCRLSLDSALAHRLKQLYDLQPTTDAAALDDPSKVTFYFASLHRGHHRIIGARRAAQFKSVAGKKLLRFIDDAVDLVDEEIFALNDTFDLLVDGNDIWILNPAGFHAMAQIEAETLAAAAENAQTIAGAIPFVELDGVAAYAGKHPSAARMLASIAHRTDLAATSEKLLRRDLKSKQVPFLIQDGKLVPAAGSELAFLKVLDRRRLSAELVEGQVETYDTPSRRRI
jgi:hypothetical protein